MPFCMLTGGPSHPFFKILYCLSTTAAPKNDVMPC